jgi:TetR/AcrR family fatty acid metabolism transcriptional regulator
MGDIVFGVMNMSVISFHELGEIKSPGFDFEDDALLVEAVILRKEETEKGIADKTSIILEAAEKVFAKKGFNKAKMTDIAKLAGVADGTIYEYFENKDSLLFSMPKRRFQHYLNDLSDIFYPESVIGKLKKLIKYHFSTLLNDPHFLRVFVYNLYLYKGFYHSEAYEAYRNYYKLFETAIEEGKASGVFRSDINARVFRNMVLGTFSQMAMRWLREKKTSELELTKEINQVADIFVEAVLA